MTWVKQLNKIFLGSLLSLLQLNLSAQNYTGKNVKVRLFSSTPVEDIRAVNVKASAVIIGKTREILVQVPIRGFEFDKKLMQEHFNENYMESDKYPFAKFKGTIDPSVDFNKNGAYDVTVPGILSVHGVDKKRSIRGKLVVNGSTLQIFTEFRVSCADHQIEIPTLIITKVAEIINIKVDGQLNLVK